MTDSTRTSARKGGKGLTVGIGVGAVLTVAGIALWAVQLSGGMVQTGMRNMDSWGLYITCLLYTSPSPRDMRRSRMPSSA